MGKNYLSLLKAFKDIYSKNLSCLFSFPFDVYIVSFVIEKKKIVGCDKGFFSSFLEKELKRKGVSTEKCVLKDDKYILFDFLPQDNLDNAEDVLLSIFSEIVNPEISISINVQKLETELKWEKGMEIPHLLVELCEKHLSINELNLMIDQEDIKIHTKGDILSTSRNLPLKPYEGFILTRIINGMKIKDLLLAANIDREKVLRSLIIFWLLDLVDIPIFGGNDTDGNEEKKATLEIPDKIRSEVESFYKRTKLEDCFQIFGLPLDASDGDIKKKFVFITQKFHPDKYQKYEDEELLKTIDAIFTKLTECYEKLKEKTSRGKYIEFIRIKEDMKKKKNEKDQSGKSGEEKNKEKPKHAYEDPVHKAKQRYIHGKEAFKNKKYFDATEHFREAVRMQPEVAEYQYWLGKTLSYNPKKLKEAEERLLKAIELKPNIKNFYLELARLYAKVGLHIKCKKMYEKVYELDPENEEAKVYLKIKKQKKKMTLKDFLNMDLKTLKDLFKK